MVVGYARTSTIEQEARLAAQVRDLKAAGAERVFSEQVSSVGQRNELDQALDFVHAGDTLMVAKPDRLARSTAHLLSIVATLEAKGVDLVILSMGGQQIDSRTAPGKLMLTMLAAVATFERDLVLERQREGIAKAAAEGKYKGRAPTARAKTEEVLKMARIGLRKKTIARRLGISVASVYRILAAGAKQAA